MLSPLSPNCSLDEDLHHEIMTQSAFEVYYHITFWFIDHTAIRMSATFSSKLQMKDKTMN